MSTNPFEEDADIGGISRNNISVSEAKVDGRDPSSMLENSGTSTIQESSTDGRQTASMSFDYIAKRLLEDNFILTALEFHAELLESGRELRRLRDYFSNPVHFETVASSSRLEFLPSTLPRTSSAQTLDSLDFARYSDDGDRQADDRVAVLEFELRKAKDTIRGLREQLTVASDARGMPRDGESNDTLTYVGGTPGSAISSGVCSTEPRHSLPNIPLKPHEKRALNFLVHEFLLQNEHKMTAVTFSDEVDDQDFEDWDDVGLNVPRPPDLHTMYRDFCARAPGYIQRRDACCFVNMNGDDDATQESNVESQTELLNKLNDENAALLERNQQLEVQLERLSGQMRQLQRNMGVATVSIGNVSTHSDGTADSVKEQEIPASFGTCGQDNRTSERNVPTWLKEKVMSTIVKSPGSGSCLCPEVTKLASSSDEVVKLFAVALPRIIPNVLLNKREELIAPLLAVAALHPDSKVRDQLLSSYFGLIKRPDDEQRQLLVTGCIAYVKSVGSVRAETELLPHCWEQMNHKHAERRLLVAETCGAIIPYLPPSLSSSLVLSMLQQMLQEDKSELVRQVVVRSLAVLSTYVEDRDKFVQIIDLMQRALTDQSEQVVLTTRSILAPCLGFWSMELGQFQSSVVGLIVKRISQVITTSSVNQAANEQLLCNYFVSLRNLTTMLFLSVLRSGPYCSNDQNKRTDYVSMELELTRFPASEGLLDDVSIFFAGRRELTNLVAQYDEWTNREWYQTWDELDFVVKEMIPQMAAALGRLDSTLNKSIRASVDYFRHCVKVFGRGLSVTKIRPLFSSLLKVEPEDKGDLATYPIAYAAFPVYVAGVLGAHYTDSDKKELKSFLKMAIVAVAQANGPCNSILTAFSELSASYPDSELILSVVWDLITHKTANVRRFCGLILSRLVRSMDDVYCLKNKLVPALITLASDRDTQVRGATMPGFGVALEISIAHEDVLEKIRMQLSAMLEEPQGPDVTVQILRMFAQVAPNLETKFRDEFVLPQMAIVCARNNALVNAETKTMIAAALFDAYSAISCCYLSHGAVVESFLPGLKGLLKDLDVERAKVAKSIIRDLENKIVLANPVDRKSSMLGPTEIAVDEMKVRMMTKFRDLKDKMDQHKENVPNLFKKK